MSLIEISSRYGLLRYGFTVGGYDSWSFREAGGGGVVTVPFAFKERALLIGVIEQQRPNQGGKVLNVPRGFIEAGEVHERAAARELWEETGLRGEPHELDGAPMNANSAFFETDPPGRGVRAFAFELPEDWLERSGAHWMLASSRVAADDASVRERAVEQIGRLLFIPWTEAAMLSDMFTVASVARLMATLQRNGRLP